MTLREKIMAQLTINTVNEF